ncbi:hypothetical protein LV82_02540 [Albidovulum inexpectatum]|uniref:Uncharacterized protein n=1 Tax=Albidovulum inexpectatum TaxID=196587 RepID=A0A2S5JED1_9RHOB|nr:hypothetical protein [Albidovulum inexpectatum]PPB79749.1 hypothetical protein LV82_02540 [Albidovulum inexpectatum]
MMLNIPSAVLKRRKQTQPPVSASLFSVTVPAGTVGSDLSGYPLMLDFGTFPASFWSSPNLRSDGGNLRAFADQAMTTPLPLDVTAFYPSLQRGRAFVRVPTLGASQATTIFLAITDPANTAPAVTDPIGRNAVWADYEVVWVFPQTVNRTGKTYTQGGTTPSWHAWKRDLYHEFPGNPHQGIAVDGAGNIITIDTNYLRRHVWPNLTTVVASNADPCGAVRTATGSTVDHLCDGTIIGDELWVPVNNYPAQSPYQEYLAVFDVATLALKRTYNLSGLAGEQISGITYVPGQARLYGCNYETGQRLHKYDLNGTYHGAVTLSAAQINAQGITWIGDRFILSCDQSGNPLYEVWTDGTVNTTPVYNRPTTGTNEGVAWDGTYLWIMDGDGDAERLMIDPARHDWARLHYATFWAELAPAAQWSMGAEVWWQHPAGDLQQAFLSYDGGASSNMEHLIYDEGPDKLGMWNSSDGWLYTSPAVNPAGYEKFAIAGWHDGTNGRKLFVNGTVTGFDSATAVRPNTASAKFRLNGHSLGQVGEAYYQYAWLRHDIVPDAWIAAVHDNMQAPGAFYSVSAI